MKKKYLFLAGFAAMVLAACSDDVTTDTPTPTPEPEVNEYVGEMQMYDGASQAGRIHAVASTRGVKSERLQFLATVDAPEQMRELNWSVTSLYLDKDNKLLYATWHSNLQAETGENAGLWGGALDVLSIDMTQNSTLAFVNAGVNTKMKFENVMRDGSYLFISGTQSKNGAGVARIEADLTGKKPLFDIIGFPGSSVNAIGKNADGKLVVISGYTGTCGSFDPNIEAGPYADEEGNIRKDIRAQKATENFGGKYVTPDGKYMLRDGENGAIIMNVSSGREKYDLGYRLLSSAKSAEKYEVDENGDVMDWEIVEGTEAQKYGKHVLVVKGNYAYVAAGGNGLRVHDLSNGGAEVSWQDQTGATENKPNYGPNTTGLYTDGDYLYAATDNGLRVYEFKEDGGLELYAFEVENYDEETGAALPDEKGNFVAAATDTEQRHSCNFVVAYPGDDNAKYIYVAYGKSGVRVYKLDPNAPAEDDAE